MALKGMWELQLKEQNIIRYVYFDLPKKYKNIRRVTKILEVVNSEYNYDKPKKGFSVFINDTNEKHFKTRSQAIKFAKDYMRKH